MFLVYHNLFIFMLSLFQGFKGNDQSTWIVARDKCRQLGADLVSIHDIGEEIFIVNTFMG